MQHIIYARSGVALSIIIPSILFGIFHSFTPNFSVLVLMNVILLGIIFAIFTYKTGNLYMAIGYHITWNFFQGNVFGIAGSYLDMAEISIIQGKIINPNILNVAEFGVEGGIYCTVLLVISILLYIKYIKKRPCNDELQKFIDLNKIEA